MVAATAAFFACAFPLSVSWFFVWRFLSGLSGGAIMVLVATAIRPISRRRGAGFVSGMIFSAWGLGIAASGTLVPALLTLGLRETWLGLGALSLVLTALSWFGWPDHRCAGRRRRPRPPGIPGIGAALRARRWPTPRSP